MQSDTIFRRKVEPQEEKQASQEKKDTDGLIISTIEETNRETTGATMLDDWEAGNGKYGEKYFNIKELVKRQPLKMQFSYIDKYIKENIGEKTPSEYQNFLQSIENNLKTVKMESFERIQKIFNYIKVLQKIESLKKIKEIYELHN